MTLILRPLGPADEDDVRTAQAELAADGFSFALFHGADTAWAEYLASLEHLRRGVDLPPDRVPMTFLVAEVQGRIVGRTSIRHTLNDWLRARGGHIGYGVVPSARRRGYATEILRQSLVIARSYGVRDALLTADDDNIASIRVIERCGGHRDPDWPGDELDGRPIGRYWIPVA